jgi:predicted membrane channel-forming protein YqfA (hemolysin III family)
VNKSKIKLTDVPLNIKAATVYIVASCVLLLLIKTSYIGFNAAKSTVLAAQLIFFLVLGLCFIRKKTDAQSFNQRLFESIKFDKKTNISFFFIGILLSFCAFMPLEMQATISNKPIENILIAQFWSLGSLLFVAPILGQLILKQFRKP